MSKPTEARDVVLALFDRPDGAALGADDWRRIDELVAEGFVNHAAGPQGRDGLKTTIATIEADLGPTRLEHHHVVADGSLVAHHLTMHGVHRRSTMPLLAGRVPTGRAVAWRFLHLWRVEDGRIVEHWACRDDLGLLGQIDDAG